ncbi:hypothetical protein yc1106_06737 [Curvularia clavata]|uniref:Uncharacterized protein n=1 Tax=Curvularia clavata TaxID=95742 RepID=A0A9Q9DT59_CURCL|nr:hypothetical protein yc1106_06737 [Curvularia clavata]
MRGFRETVCNAVSKFTGMGRVKRHNSKEALASIRAQILVGERKALQNLREYGHTVTTADVASIENAYRSQSVAAPLVAGEQNGQQTLHSVCSVQRVATVPVESANNLQSQLLATDHDTLEALHDHVFGTTACVDDACSPQTVEASPAAWEPDAFQTLQGPVFTTQGVTPALFETVYSPQSVELCSIKREHATKIKVGIAERKRRDLWREYRQMAAVQKRIDQHRACRAEMATSGISLCRAAANPSAEVLYTQRLTSPSYLATLNLAHDRSFYESQTDEESRKYVQERLMNILGPERMKFELLPSGHNHIDPAIADYNQQLATNYLLEQWEAHKIEQRRQEEEQKRQAEEEGAERLRIQILLNHYRERYINRVERLALYAPDLTKGIDLIEAALMTGDREKAAGVTRALVNEVLLPIYGLLTECKQEIPLEEVGADKLKGVWPLERLEAMYFCLKGKLDFFPEAFDMLQGIEIVCMAIANPTPFQDPLAPKSVPANKSYMTLPTKTTLPIRAAESAPNTLPSGGLSVPAAPSAPAGSGFAKLVQATTQAVNAYQQKDSAPASSGFAKLLAATAEAVSTEQQKESVPASSGFSKLLAATAEKFNGTQEAAPETAPEAAPVIPSADTAPPESTARAAVLQFIATDNMYFESEVQDLIKRNTVVGIHRRNAIKSLKGLTDLANGEKGILGDMDAGSFRCQIENCVTKIDALKGAARLNKETQALRKLCGSALMLWANWSEPLNNFLSEVGAPLKLKALARELHILASGLYTILKSYKDTLAASSYKELQKQFSQQIRTWLNPTKKMDLETGGKAMHSIAHIKTLNTKKPVAKKYTFSRIGF